MRIENGSIWYDTETDDYVMVSDVRVNLPFVEHHSSSVAAPVSDVRVFAGDFDSYGPLWSAACYTVEEFIERHDQTEMDMDEALDAKEQQYLDSQK